MFAPIDTVDVVDPATVKVTLKNPQGSFLYNMGWGDAVIVAPESAETNKDKPVGTGPFKFDHWTKGSEVTIVKADGYWGDPVVARQGRVPHRSRRGGRRSGAACRRRAGLPVLSAPTPLAQIKDDPRFKVVVGSTEGETILSTNNKKPPFDNLKVRQAIAHALDRKAIIDGAVVGLRHADRRAFRAANPGLCRPDRHLSATTSPRPRRCCARPAIPTASRRR